MRKLRLLVLASLVAGVANAQYFQHVYGDQRRDYLESGVNVDANDPQLGHLMTGYTDLVGWDNLEVTRTDIDGRIGGPQTFNTRYPMMENNQTVDAKGRRIIHPAALNGRILVWGDYGFTPNAVSTKFFLAMLDPDGGVSPFTYYFQLPYQVAEAEATSMTYSTTQPNTAYLCGFIRMVAGGQRYPIALSVDPFTGAVNWGRVYQLQNIDWQATDIVESPYMPTGVQEIALVGHFQRPGFVESGFFLRVDAQQGCPVAPVVEYGAPFNGYAAAINAIDIANNNYGSGPGFILGGYSFNPTNGSDDFWALKISPDGMTIDFTNTIGYSNGGKEYGYDIIERMGTANYEYFVGGYVDNGFFGANDALVQKLDFSGKPVAGGEFTYGGSKDDRAYQLDQYNTGMVPPPFEGLSTFGTTNASFGGPGALDFYLVKSYFNGVVPCNVRIKDAPSGSGPKIAETWNSICMDQFYAGPVFLNKVPISEKEICYKVSDSSGDNSRIGAENAVEQLFQPGYFPNPVSRDNALVTVTFGQEVVDGNAEVELWNAVGQLVWKKSVPVTKGQGTMQVALGNELNGGMYHLIVRQNGALNNYRILVQ